METTIACLKSFAILLFALNWQLYSRFLSECGAMGAALFLLRYYKRSVSVSGKATGIIYHSEYWISPLAPLRIHHHLFGYNKIVLLMIIILRLLFWSFRLNILNNGSNQSIKGWRVRRKFELITSFWCSTVALSLALILYATSESVFKRFMLLCCTKNCDLRQALFKDFIHLTLY